MSWLRAALRELAKQRAKWNHRDSNRLVGGWLKAFRGQLGASQADLAVLLSIPISDIAKFEAGRKRVPAAQLYVLAQYFDVPVAAFFGYGSEVK